MGGGSKSLIDVARMLKDDFEVIACIPNGSAELKNILISEGISVEEIFTPFPQLPRYSGGPSLISRTMLRMILNIRNVKKFCMEVENLSPDAIIFNSIVTTVSAPYFNSKLKKICVIRETIVHKLSRRYFKFILDKYIAGVCFLSEMDKKRMSLKNSRSIVIPDSVPLDNIMLGNKDEARKLENLHAEEFLILFMGGNDKIKGVNTIIKAIMVIGSGSRLLLAGDFDMSYFTKNKLLLSLKSPKYFLYLINLKKNYKNADKKGLITRVGFRQSISSLMNACDVVVFPSTKVHQARPCIEAGYYSRPVILSDFEETREYFIDGYNALTFKPNNYHDLAAKLVIAKNNPQKMRIIGQNNYVMSNTYHNYYKIQNDLHRFIVDLFF